MRVLLDECLPRRLKHELVGHDAKTAPEMGWARKTNGELLARAAREFDAFLTADRNLSYQQDVSTFNIAVSSWSRGATPSNFSAHLCLRSSMSS